MFNIPSLYAIRSKCAFAEDGMHLLYRFHSDLLSIKSQAGTSNRGQHLVIDHFGTFQCPNPNFKCKFINMRNKISPLQSSGFAIYFVYCFSVFERNKFFQWVAAKCLNIWCRRLDRFIYLRFHFLFLLSFPSVEWHWRRFTHWPIFSLSHCKASHFIIDVANIVFYQWTRDSSKAHSYKVHVKPPASSTK